MTWHYTITIHNTKDDELTVMIRGSCRDKHPSEAVIGEWDSGRLSQTNGICHLRCLMTLFAKNGLLPDLAIPDMFPQVRVAVLSLWFASLR